MRTGLPLDDTSGPPSPEGLADALAPGPSSPAEGQYGRRPERRRRQWWLVGLLAVWGPGLVVMLADTDAGSLVTAAQSGARWGYRMVLPSCCSSPCSTPSRR